MVNQTISDVTVLEASDDSLPVWCYVVVGVCSVTIMSLCLLLFCKCFVRARRRKASESAATAAAAGGGGKPADPWLTGVLADQAIEFVVPHNPLYKHVLSQNDTTCTEDSDSDVVFRRSTNEERKLRKRSSLITFYISPEDLEKTHYPEAPPQNPKRKSLLAGLGRVGFSLNYNVARQTLYVRLIGASDLPSSLSKDSANPFAKVMLLPDKTHKFLTKIQRHTVNPLFNETFAFPLKREALDKKDLKISVLDYDRFSRKLLIGFVRMPLKDAGITSQAVQDVQTGDIWTDLSLELDADKQGQGELLCSLCYNPDTSSLTVAILKARKLENEDRLHLVYVKVSLYVRKRLVRTKKTLARKFHSEMEFNDAFPIHVTSSSLPDVDVVVTVCGKGGKTGKQVLGRCQVGANSPSEQGASHWQDMLASPRSSAAQWHSFSG